MTSLSKNFVNTIRGKPGIVGKIKNNNWIKKKKRFISYISGIATVALSFLHPIIGLGTGVAVTHVILVLDP